MKCPRCFNKFDFLEEYFVYSCKHCQMITLDSDHPLIRMAEDLIDFNEWNNYLVECLNSKEFEMTVLDKLSEKASSTNNKVKI